jgi:multidrug efflux pump subunit AcrB
MKGIVGRFFYEFGITIAFAVLVSLFVSFTLDPMLSSRWYDPAVETRLRRRGLARALEAFDNWFLSLRNTYEKAIRFSLRHRAWILILSLAFFAGGLMIFDTLGEEFMPSYDRGEFQLSFKTNPGSSIEQTEDISNDIVRLILSKPGVSYALTTIGAGSTSALNEGTVYVKLKPKKERAFPMMCCATASEKSSPLMDARLSASRMWPTWGIPAAAAECSGTGYEGAGSNIGPRHGQDPDNSRRGGHRPEPGSGQAGNQGAHRPRGGLGPRHRTGLAGDGDADAA